MALLESAIEAGGGILSTFVNNKYAEKREQQAREENFRYNEHAANNADARTRALYNDLYSPAAQMQQLKDAGLSPSIYASGGLAGKSGMSGAQGAGAGGIAPNVFGIDPLAASQIAVNHATAAKINEDTISAKLNNEIQKLNNSTYKNKWALLNNQTGTIYYNQETGNITSLSDIANAADNYDQFENAVLNKYGGNGNIFLSSEEGRKTLRDIYENNRKFGNDIAVLANSEENANLMLKIATLLNNDTFAQANADAQIQQLRQMKESAELTEKQKGAMNRLIEKMGNNTTSDIILTLLMMLGSYSHANINLSSSRNEQVVK